jgi:DNA-binding NarL/FixJ family response regulator
MFGDRATATFRHMAGDRADTNGLDPNIPGWDELTESQRTAAKLAAAGLSNPEIARRMMISRGTVKSHLAAAYGRLGLANRIELAIAVARAGRNGPR